MTHPATVEERLSLLESNLRTTCASSGTTASGASGVTIGLSPSAINQFPRYTPFVSSSCPVPECKHTPAEDDGEETTGSPVFDDTLVEEVVEGAYQAIASLSEVARTGTNREILEASGLLKDFLESAASWS